MIYIYKKCIIVQFIFLKDVDIFINVYIIQVESTHSIMRIPPCNSEFNPKSQSTSLSSTSSIATHKVESESKPLTSTSAFQAAEIDLQPLVEEESHHVRFLSFGLFNIGPTTITITKADQQ